MTYSRKPSYLPFVLLFAFLVYTKWRQFPELYAQADFQWEEAYTFFYNAKFSNLSGALFTSDFGYLPFPQRLIALVIELLRIPPAVVPEAYHWTVLFLVSGLQASIALPAFRPLIRQDWARVGLGFLVAKDPRMMDHVLLNFTYAGSTAFLATLCLIDRFAALSTRRIVLVSSLLSLIIVSKALFLSFLPLITVLFTYGVWRKWRHWIAMTAPMLAAFGVQIVYVLYNRPFLDGHTDDPAIREKLWEVFAVTLKLISGSILGWNAGPPALIYGVGIFAMGAVIFSFVRAGTKKTPVDRNTLVIGAVLLTTVTNVVLRLASRKQALPFGALPSWLDLTEFYRWQISIAYNGLLMGAMVFLFAIARKRTFLGVVLVAFWLMGIHGLPVYSELTKVMPVGPDYWRRNAWKRTVGMLDSESFCIEIAAEATLHRNCRISERYVLEWDVYRAPHRVATAPYSLPSKLHDERALWVGLVLSPESRQAGIEMDFIDAKGEVLHTARALEPDIGLYSIYALPGPTPGIRSIRLRGLTGKAVEVRYSSLRDRPIWIWAAQSEDVLDTERGPWYTGTTLTYGGKRRRIPWMTGTGASATWIRDPRTSQILTVASSYMEAPVPEDWPAIFFNVPTEVERRLAGKAAKIRIRARPGSNRPTPRFLAGIRSKGILRWNAFPLEDGSHDYEFHFRFPDDQAASLHLWPDPSGKSGSMVIESIDITESP